MSPSIRLIMAVLALNLFALTLHDPAASSRPVRAESAADAYSRGSPAPEGRSATAAGR